MLKRHGFDVYNGGPWTSVNNLKQLDNQVEGRAIPALLFPPTPTPCAFCSSHQPDS